jgi:hypothetical protein
MLSAQHPPWLWVSLIIVTIAAVTTVCFHVRSWRWLLAGILLPAASATAIALALANISVGARPRVVILLDFSGSTRHSPWRDPAWVQSIAQRHLEPHQPLTVIAFAGNQRHVFLPDITPADSWPAQFVWDVSPTATTDLAAALSGDPAGPNAAPWVITDGLFPTSAIPSLPRAAWTILPPTAPDAAVRDVVLRAAGPDQLEIMVQLSVTGIRQPLTARITVECDGTPLADQTTEFRAPPPGGATMRWLTLRDHLENAAAPPRHYSARIQLPGDLWPENDLGSAVWAGAADRRMLIVGASRPADLPGEFIPTDRFTPDAAQLAAEGWQLIVLSDVPAETQADAPALSPAAAHALDTFVRDNGAGLLLLANAHAFGPGRYGEGTVPGDLLEALSPVSSHPQKTGGLNVLFLLDASSSMNELAPGTTERKFALLSRGVQDAAAYLADDDDLTLVTFGSGARLLTSGTSRDLRPTLAAHLASVQPAQGTNPDVALPPVADFMRKPGRHLVILLTDGEIPWMDIPRWQTALQTPNTHLAIIAPASTSGSMLQRLAAALPDASWSQTQNPAAWAAALRQAVLEQARGTVQSTPLPWQTTSDHLSATAPLERKSPDLPNGSTADALFGTAATWTRTWPKPESTPRAASTDHSVPVAAVAQRGLGKVAALCLADDATPAYQALRQRLIQTVAAAPGDRRFTAAAARTAGGWLITVDAIDAGKFMDGLKLLLQPLPAGDHVPLLQTAPGHYEAHVTSAPNGLAAVIVRPDSPDPLVARLQTAAVETAEWPATVQTPASLPPGVTVLPANDVSLWTPPAAPLALSPSLWLLATATALAALWTRTR